MCTNLPLKEKAGKVCSLMFHNIVSSSRKRKVGTLERGEERERHKRVHTQDRKGKVKRRENNTRREKERY